MSTFTAGDEVKFLHQAKGKSKEKIGRVVDIIPSGENGISVLPAYVKHSQIQFQPVNEKIDRILVSVERGGKSAMNDYYAPYELSVKRA